jgi:hypothetical protein
MNRVEIEKIMSERKISLVDSCPHCKKPYIKKMISNVPFYFSNCECDKKLRQEREKVEKAQALELNRKEIEQARLERKNLILSRLHPIFREILEDGRLNAGRIHVKVREQLEYIMKGEKPRNMVIMGPSYGGKTIDINWLYHEIGDPSFIIQKPNEIFFDVTKKGKSIEIYYMVKRLCIDDIDKINSNHVREMIFEILDYRHNYLLETDATTNLNEIDLENGLGLPIKNRLFEYDAERKTYGALIVKKVQNG